MERVLEELYFEEREEANRLKDIVITVIAEQSSINFDLISH